MKLFKRGLVYRIFNRDMLIYAKFLRVKVVFRQNTQISNKVTKKSLFDLH